MSFILSIHLHNKRHENSAPYDRLDMKVLLRILDLIAQY